MFRNTYKKIFFFTTIFAVYYEWLTALVVSENSHLAMSYPASHHYDEMLSMEMAVKFNNFIYTDTMLEAEYSAAEYRQDKGVIIDMLMHIYILDQCIIDMLDYSQDFKIYLIKNLSVIPSDVFADALFDSYRNILFIETSIHERDRDVTFQKIAHELKHAVDSYNNLGNGYCMNAAGKRAIPYLHSSHKFWQDCRDDEESSKLLLEKFNKDFYRIVAILNSLRKNSQDLTKTENARLETLANFIWAHQYTLTPSELYYNDTYNLDELALQLQNKNYSFDNKTHKYAYTNQFYTFDIPLNYLDAQFNFKVHIKEHSAKSNISTVLLTDPYDDAISNLSQDLLLNVVRVIAHAAGLFKDNNAQFLYEVSAYLSGILTAYAPPVEFKHKMTTLRNWLFPRLTAHEKTRYAKVYAECEDGRLMDPGVRVGYGSRGQAAG